MSQTGLAAFDRTVQVTNVWLDDLMVAAGWDDRRRAYRALRAVLHAVRDHLPAAEAVSLAAQLPVLVRGVYYEGWHPDGAPLKDRHQAGFLTRVADELGDDPWIAPEAAARAVFRVLDRHLTPGAADGARAVLPREIRELWD